MEDAASGSGEAPPGEAELSRHAQALGVRIAPERVGDVLDGARRLRKNGRLLARFVAEAEPAAFFP